jgi:crotonobetaine/carnitine-CoA ligase
MSENRLEMLELWLGCAWLGAVFVPVNTAARGAQLEHLLELTQPAAVVAEPELAHLLPGEPWTFGGSLPPPGDAVAPAEVGPGDPAAILMTSGTTGPSKGVVCPHAQWYWWAALTGRVLGIGEGSVLYTNLPLFHTNALNAFCQALLAGGEYVLGPKFSASRFWSRLGDADATVTYLLGAMVSILLRRPPTEDDRMHRVQVALAPGTPAELHAPFLERFGVRLIDAWGSTETNIVISNTIADNRPGTLGRPLAEFEARVVDDDDEPLADGAAGELVLRPREAFSFAGGYFRKPEETLYAWRNLWFHTGDLVVRDVDGTFRFVDRLKDMIRRRGENVSSYEVEQALLAHPDVAAAAVFPVPSDLGDDDVMAALVAREGARIDPPELVRFLEPRLAFFAVPRYVELVAELPLTESGKMAKYRLRERGVTADTWDREAAAPEVTRR